MAVSEREVFALYETAVEPARRRLERGRALESVLGDADAAKLARFMFSFLRSVSA
jgi:hypothetical protein